MAIEFDCPSCGGTLRVGDESAGRIIRCGGCMTSLRVPAAAAPLPPEPPPPPNPYGGPSYSPPPPPPPARRSNPEANPDESPAPVKPVSPRRRDRDRDRDDYDEDRRERRSRRRSPPPPAGKGVFFWLVIIGAILLVGMVVCCGGMLLLMPDADWHPHESKGGGFQVELPARPQEDIAKATNLRLENGTHAEGAVLLRKGAEKFVVIYRDIDPTKHREGRGGDEKELDDRVKRLKKAMGAEQLDSDIAFFVDGFPAREVEFRGKNGWHKARIIIANTRLYIVLAGGGVAQPGDADVTKFLESFKITDPELLAEGKRREEQAKQQAEKEKSEKARDVRRKAEEEEEQKRSAEARKTEKVREAAEAVAEMAIAIAGKARPAPPPVDDGP